MFLSPQNFLDQYIDNQQPFFTIHEGNSTRNRVMEKFMEHENGETKEDAMSEGLERLESFFAKYPEGRVLIITKGSKNSDSKYSIGAKVRWEGSVVSGHNQNTNQMMMPGVGNMNQFMQMGQFFHSLYKPQMESERRNMELQFELERERDYTRSLQEGGDEDLKTLALKEAIGAIKPISQMIAGSIVRKSAAPPLAAVAGTGGAPSEQVIEEAESDRSGAVSFDHLFVCCRNIHAEFPQYHINDLFEVFANLIKENKAMLVPMIDQAMADFHNTKNQQD